MFEFRIYLRNMLHYCNLHLLDIVGMDKAKCLNSLKLSNNERINYEISDKMATP